jgi:hypothetical protein
MKRHGDQGTSKKFGVPTRGKDTRRSSSAQALENEAKRKSHFSPRRSKNPRDGVLRGPDQSNPPIGGGIGFRFGDDEPSQRTAYRVSARETPINRRFPRRAGCLAIFSGVSRGK